MDIRDLENHFWIQDFFRAKVIRYVSTQSFHGMLLMQVASWMFLDRKPYPIFKSISCSVTAHSTLKYFWFGFEFDVAFVPFSDLDVAKWFWTGFGFSNFYILSSLVLCTIRVAILNRKLNRWTFTWQEIDTPDIRRFPSNGCHCFSAFWEWNFRFRSTTTDIHIAKHSSQLLVFWTQMRMRWLPYNVCQVSICKSVSSGNHETDKTLPEA